MTEEPTTATDAAFDDDYDDAPGWLGDEPLFGAGSSAIAGLVLGGVSLLGLASSGEITQAVLTSTRSVRVVAIGAAIQLTFALVGFGLGLVAVRGTTGRLPSWVSAAGRAAVVVGGFATLVNLVALLVTLTTQG